MAAYAFTDFRSQGQTINQVIIDIAPPPRGTLSLFNLYVDRLEEVAFVCYEISKTKCF